jgi:hypothetical protein
MMISGDKGAKHSAEKIQMLSKALEWNKDALIVDNKRAYALTSDEMKMLTKLMQGQAKKLVEVEVPGYGATKAEFAQFVNTLDFKQSKKLIKFVDLLTKLDFVDTIRKQMKTLPQRADRTAAENELVESTMTAHFWMEHLGSALAVRITDELKKRHGTMIGGGTITGLTLPSPA